jgi:hypothetical protein
MKPILNKWQLVWRLQPSFYHFYGYEFSFGLVKFTSLPEPGYMIELKHHRGLVITFSTVPMMLKIRRRRIWIFEVTYPTGFGLLRPRAWIRIW